ncbi:MAG: thermonuclease family protein [Gammaproteobacteria bacterium]|nr:thermonuclease family protein [Gammaproteobacteria bacterium]
MVRVKDGDSLVVDSNGREVEVRLADIDTPEFDQPRGDEARDVLRSLVDGKEVRLELVGGDAYRRIVAHVFVGDLDVNAELVRRGLAWVRRAYDPAPSLVALEDGARQAKRGLWADEDPVPPWIWRKTEQSTDRQLGAIPQVECGTKQSCAKMTSCEEAIAFLRQCKLTRIDGDGDGVPCEKLCRYYR